MIPAYLAPFVNHLWQSTLFAAIVGLLTLVVRTNQARVRHALWLCASCKFLVPFSLLVSIGGQLHFSDTAPAAPPIVQQATHIAMGDIFLRQAVPEVAIAAPAKNWTPEILLTVWLLGTLAVVVGWGLQWLRIRALVRAAKPLPNVYSAAAPIPVRSTSALLEPGIFGIIWPVLLMPEGIEDRLTSSELVAIVAHELCHVRRRDNLTAMIHLVVEATFWFHPLTWWISKRLIEERERACDEEVLRMGNDPEAYAEGILKVCEHYLESPAMCVAGVTGSDLKRRISEIMRGRAARGLGFGKKALLALAGVVAIAVPVAVGMVGPAALRAQNTSPKHLVFEVASVKLNTSDDRTFGGIEFQPGGRVSIKETPLWFVIAAAFDLPFQGAGERLSGGPDWLRSARYDIEATPEKGWLDGASSVSARQERIRSMLQSLLADRFKMVVRRDTKEVPVYAAVVGKNGVKLEKSRVNEKDCEDGAGFGVHIGEVKSCHSFNGGMGRGLHAEAADMEDLAAYVSNWSDRPVVDKTGLKGLFKIETVGWAPMHPANINGQSSDTAVGEDGVPWSDRQTLFTIFEKMGLKLESQRAAVESIVIVSAQRPTEN